MSVFTKKPENTTEQMVLSLLQMKDIIAGQNYGNRAIQPRLIANYAKQIKAGEWDFDFPEGRIVVVDCDSANILSGQHRMMAMVESETEFWPVTVQYVNRDKWLKRSIEKRSSSDIVEIVSGGSPDIKMDRDLASAFAATIGQLPLVQNGFSSTSGAAGKAKLSEQAMLFAYGDKAREFWEELPKVYRPKKELAAAMMLLYFIGVLELEDICYARSGSTRLGSGLAYLEEEKNFGLRGGIKQLAYAIAVLHHAKTSQIDENYLKVPEDRKPVYVKAGVKYIFCVYE